MVDIKPVVLVTGGSRGLGRGIALLLAKKGYSVVINFARNAQAAEKTLEECRTSATQPSQQFLAVQADVSDSASRNSMIEKIYKEMGRLDALVNNAGIAPKERADITEASEDSFEEIIRTNLQGPYFLTQKVVNSWLEGKNESLLPAGFTIIFVTSISAYTASVNRGDYCISKAGLSMASQLWASRLAGEGIQVYELRPGIMLTDMTSGVKEKYDKIIEAENIVPQKRWGTEKDLGLAVSSLLEGSFPFSTGTVIDIDGGFNLQRL